jgi:hypothetical protein
MGERVAAHLEPSLAHRLEHGPGDRAHGRRVAAAIFGHLGPGQGAAAVDERREDEDEGAEAVLAQQGQGGLEVVAEPVVEGQEDRPPVELTGGCRREVPHSPGADAGALQEGQLALEQLRGDRQVARALRGNRVVTEEGCPGRAVAQQTVAHARQCMAAPR